MNNYRLVFSAVRALLGGKIRIILSGGAPLAAETHRNLRAVLCAPILQGYGLTGKIRIILSKAAPYASETHRNLRAVLCAPILYILTNLIN